MSTESIKILLVEDNPGDARLLGEMLAAIVSVQFHVTHASSLGEALRHLEEVRFAVILLDLSLPDSQGFETFGRVQAKAPAVPIVVLSGFEDEKLAIKAAREGAQDYLVKGQVNDRSLVRAIRYAIERHKTLSESLPQPRRQPGKVLGFIGAKGGVGTTTVALNVAAALARRGKSVIAVELRPYPGTFSLLVKQAPLENLADVMKLGPAAINERQLKY
ncbi:MAG TPA: response regulator, partial [Gemmataceae bacterium]|nr:response regulator [Gemmataceae bacterium]